MKFCAYFTEYFRIKHTKFAQDAFRIHISVVHCVGFTFFGHSVDADKMINFIASLTYCTAKEA